MDLPREKFERILRFADGLPSPRSKVDGHLRKRRLTREKALVAATMLLDRTHIRVGTEEYAAENRTYGLATLRSRHVRLDGDTLILDFEGKGGADQHAELTDARVARVVAEMDALPGYEVFSAKDFRTWAGTVAAAIALDEVGPIEGARDRQRAVAQVCRVAADLLGNTPAVCRAGYIDPRVIDHFLDGVTVSSLMGRVEQDLRAGHSAQELAVLALLRRGLRERVAA